MKHKPIFVILFILFITSLIVFANLELMASPKGTLTSNLISNHPDTNQSSSIYYVDAKASQNAAHVAWVEQTKTDPYDSDVFYRQLPYSETINLSSKVPTTGSVTVSTEQLIVQPSTGDNVCVLWSEQTGVEEFSLFLWRSNSDNTTMSPNPVSIQADIKFTEFTCNNEANAKVVFTNSDNDLYLWDEEANTITKLSNELVGGVGDLQRVNVGNHSYVAWKERFDGSFNQGVYIWDSINESTQKLANDGLNLQLFNDKNGTIFLFWGRLADMAPPCKFYWDSGTNTTQTVMPCDDWTFDVTQDEEGNIHSAWYKFIGSTNINYWNMTENVTRTVGSPTQSVRNMNLIGGSDNKAHIFWDSSGLNYWNSDTLSETKVTSTVDYLLQQRIQFIWDFDSNGQIHAVLVDASPDNPSYTYTAYWTPTLTSTKILTDAVYSPNIGLLVDDNQDVVHSIFSGPDEKLYYWNDQTDDIEAIASPKPYVPTKIIDMALDKNDQIFAFYQDSSYSHFYWSSEIGEVYLGEGFSNEKINPMLDDMGNVYANWIAKELALESVQAAWQTEFTHFVYLPTVIK